MIRAGVAEVDITPPMGVEMWGYGPYQKRLCTEVLDPLYANALWLESGEERLAIVSLDLGSIALETRDEAARRIKESCGLNESRLMVCATHTHSGPAAQFVVGWGERDPGYVASLPGLIAKAVLAARDAKRSAKIGCGGARITGVGFNRDRAAGIMDPYAQLMRIDAEDGALMAVLYNYGAHCVVRYPFTSRISADWPGLVAAYLKTEMKGTDAIFLQGPCGDTNAHQMTFARSDPLAQQKVCDMRVGDVAKRFGDQILPALKAIETRPDAELAAAYDIVELPHVKPDKAALEATIGKNIAVAEKMKYADLAPQRERLEKETEDERAWRNARFAVDAARRQLKLLEDPAYAVRAPIQVLRIGAAALVGWPGEIFVELGIEIRQRSPVPMTFVASFANETVGYVPTAAAYESQGRPNEFSKYPTTQTPKLYGRLPFRSDVGRVLIDETLRIINKLW